MATANRPMKSALPRIEGLVEMNRGPITRIVGSLGIFTKIICTKRAGAFRLSRRRWRV
jgi:hypothetical protein